MLEWFPQLPCYQEFSRRLNLLAPAFQALSELWLDVIIRHSTNEGNYIVDSCPIILAKGPRSGHAKIAGELCEKSYNSSRKEWYYGVKLHAFVARHAGRLPTPLVLMLSGAASHDLTAAKQIMEDQHPLAPGNLFADKAYIDVAWADLLRQDHKICILTPRKKRKDDTISGDFFSTFVSSVRQPIECFFNWLNRLTNIQTASIVRSTTGLLLHIFGRIATALAMLIFNS